MSQGNPEAREVEEGAISGEQMLMTDQQASELAKPGVGSFDDPTPLVAPQSSAISIAPLLGAINSMPRKTKRPKVLGRSSEQPSPF